MAYYNNPRMLKEQLKFIGALDPEVRAHLDLTIVDDCSPDSPAIDVWRNPGVREARLYRMLVDLAWNWTSCKNLAVAEAQTEWVLMTDIDHYVPEGTLRTVLQMDADPDTIYRFTRVTAPDMTPYKPHPNSWFMTCDMFRRLGGYDENFAGTYGNDGRFGADCRRLAGDIVLLDRPLIRVPREVVKDASTRGMDRKGPENDRKKAEIMALGLPKRTGRFPWKRLR